MDPVVFSEGVETVPKQTYFEWKIEANREQAEADRDIRSGLGIRKFFLVIVF